LTPTNTERVIEYTWGEFIDWLLERWPNSADTHYRLIKHKMGLTRIPKSLTTVPSKTTPLTPTEVEMAWPVLKSLDERLWMAMRLIYELGVDPAFILGNGKDYDGIMPDDLQIINERYFLDCRQRGGGVWRYRLPNDLGDELAAFMRSRKVAHPAATATNIFGFSKCNGWTLLRKAIDQMAETGIVRKGLRGAFLLWKKSPRLRPYANPQWRDHREMAC
jgi:hypothetical protein